MLCLLVFMLSAYPAKLFSQKPEFFKAGTIEFERRQNIMAAFNNDPRLKTFVAKTGSEIYTTYFTMTIEPNQSIYQLSKNNGVFNQFPDMPADNNTIYYDLTSGKRTELKNMNGKTFFITDDDRQVEWKLTDETKIIAGYTCRRANAIMFDSIYVVAFYCDKFPYQVGPESFGGLPGLILGLSMQSEHISWFATKITQEEVPPKITAPAKQGTIITAKNFKAFLVSTIFNVPVLGPVMYKRALF